MYFRAASALTSERSGSYKGMSRDHRLCGPCSMPDLELVQTKIFFENRYASCQTHFWAIPHLVSTAEDILLVELGWCSSGKTHL